MKHLPFESIEQAKAATLAGDGVVLFANEDALVVLLRCEDRVVRDDAGGVWEVDTFVSLKHQSLIDASVYPPGHVEPFEWNGVTYSFGSYEIADVTPVDQSDLTNPGAIAAKTPEMYEPIDSVIACWTNPESAEIKELLASIQRGDEATSETPNGT